MRSLRVFIFLLIVALTSSAWAAQTIMVKQTEIVAVESISETHSILYLTGGYKVVVVHSLDTVFKYIADNPRYRYLPFVKSTEVEANRLRGQ